MYLEILTPERKIYEGEVDIATFPGADGSFQVLDNHAPLISLLTQGMVEYGAKTAAREQVHITGGVVEVLKNKVILLADGIVL
jgi:F-type H+-transporting ATPase subunit epsilon